MNEYILKLIDADLEDLKNQLISWDKMQERFKTEQYQVKRKIAIENKIFKIRKYRIRFINDNDNFNFLT